VATDDTQRLVTGSEAAPASFEVPGNGQIRPKAIYATFDGSAAGAEFLPALKITSDAGELVGVYATDSSVAAGASADVSWFPHLAAAAAAPTPTSTGLPVASLFSATGGVSIAADSSAHYVSLRDGVSSAGFSTTDSTTFANLSTTLFTGSAIYGIGIQAAGTYAVYNNAFSISGGTAGRKVTAYWSASNGSGPDTWDSGQSGVGPHLFLHEWMTVSVGQTPAVLAVWGQVNGGTATNVAFQMMVVQLSTSVLSKL
jgi:hypothetical protein